MNVPTWAVVPSNGRHFLRGCIDALRPQVDGIVVVANGGYSGTDLDVPVMRDKSSDMNISRWWNIGIDAVTRRAEDREATCWNTLVVNDDVVAPPHLVRTLSARMRDTTAVLAYPNQHDNHSVMWTRPEPVNLFHRITGYCFMLRGEDGLRLDESLVWWYGDDDLDWRARTAGGSMLVPGCAVEHKAPNGSMISHPELHVQAGKDRETFVSKWGRAPW